jgi:nitrite reductase (NO-forming)
MTVMAACAPFALLQPAQAPQARPDQVPLPIGIIPPTEPASVRVTASEFAFDQSTLRAQVGQRITVTVDNRGLTDHNLRIEALGAQVAAKPGQSASGDFTFQKAGSYEFFCAIPGHKEAGMHGTVIVDDATTAPKSAHADHSTPLTEPVDQSVAGVQPLPLGLTRLPQPQVAPPIQRTESALVKVDLETTQVTALLADGVAYNFWTFNGTVPGPMIRVRQGDTVELKLRNSPDMPVTHSINLHAVNGPGGGSVDTQVAPGDQSTIRFKALHPGVYVYHCMTPMVGLHVANGMYGMIVVEPPEGLPQVDREFYMMQGDFYLQGGRGQSGLRDLSIPKLLDENPDYVVFNGSVGSMTGQHGLKAKVGETVRFFFGVGGPNKDSAFHVVGESFDRVHPEGATETLTNVQTTLVPPGGATMVEMKLSVPGHYMIEDHHVTRLEKGGMADLEVEGNADPNLFEHLANTDDAH